MTDSNSTSYAQALKSARLQYEDVFSVLEAMGLQAEFTQTGGMCAAIEIELGGDRMALVTDSDGPLSWERADHRGWAVGTYALSDASDALTLKTAEDGSLSALLPLLSSLT